MERKEDEEDSVSGLNIVNICIHDPACVDAASDCDGV